MPYITDQLETLTRQDIKKNNRVRIYKLLCDNEKLSRQEIALQLNLSLPTVGKNLAEMEQEGMITSAGKKTDTGGRNSRIFEILPLHRVAIAVSVTKAHISAVAINLLGQTVSHVRYRHKFSRSDDTYMKISEAVSEVIRQGSIPEQHVLEVSIVLPALINLDQQSTYYNKVLNIDDFVTCAEFSKYIPYPSKFCHDTTSAAYAESHYNKSVTDFFYMMLSDSIGGAVVLNNMLYPGINNRSCEIAHIRLFENGKKCYCGHHGCMDPYCSTRALSVLTNGDLPLFFDLLKKKDEEATALWEEYLHYLAIAITDVRMLFDCSIIIGGYLGEYCDMYLEDLRRLISEKDPFCKDINYLSVCECKNEASATGAALASIDRYILSV